jgi:hypothetical protein
MAFGTFWGLGRFIAGAFCIWDVLRLACFEAWNVLRLGSFCIWNVLYLGLLVAGTLYLGTFCLGTFCMCTWKSHVRVPVLDQQLGIRIGGHRRRLLCRRFPTSDIDPSYSDMRKKYVGLKISYSFKGRVLISTSKPIPTSDINILFLLVLSSLRLYIHISTIQPKSVKPHLKVVDIRYRIAYKSLFQYLTYCRTLLSSVRYRRFRYRVESAIADHRYRTKRPPGKIWQFPSKGQAHDIFLRCFFRQLVPVDFCSTSLQVYIFLHGLEYYKQKLNLVFKT